jgi:endonuclease/exonuclease/phosphatase (EEP) superfamily protein YafD
MIAWAGAGLVALGVSFAFLGRLGWPFEIAASLAPQIGAAALLFAVGSLALGQPAAGLIDLIGAGLCCYAAREQFAPADPPIASPHVRLVWANVFGRSAALARVMALAEAVRADLVLIAELPRALSREDEARLVGPFMHRAGRPDLDGVWVAAFARSTIGSPAPIAWSPGARRRGLVFTIETAAGPLRVAGIHPHVPFTPGMTRSRNATIQAAFAVMADGGAPAALVGDFNTTPWSAVLRRATRGGVTRASPGARSTWLTPLPVLGLPIDHAYVCGGARACARVGPFVGSDHRPLIVDVALDPRRMVGG